MLSAKVITVLKPSHLTMYYLIWLGCWYAVLVMLLEATFLLTVLAKFLNSGG